MQIAVVFETRKGNANDGKIVATFTDNEGTSASDYAIGLGVVSPTGEVLCTYTGNVGNLDIGGTASLDIDIPLDSNGDYLAGEYDLQLSWYNLDSSDNGLVEPSYIYTPHHTPDHAESDLITLATTLSCDAETLVAEDTTEYGEDYTRLTRLITITPPSITGVSPLTSSSSQLTAAVTYTNVTYSSLLAVSFEYNVLEVTADVGIISRASASIYKENPVDCDPKMCAVVKCLASKFDNLKAKAVKVGGWSGLSEEDLGNFQYATALVTLAQQLRVCGEYDLAKPYVDEAKNLLKCDCGCAENTNPTPL